MLKTAPILKQKNANPKPGQNQNSKIKFSKQIAQTFFHQTNQGKLLFNKSITHTISLKCEQKKEPENTIKKLENIKNPFFFQILINFAGKTLNYSE